MTPKFIYGTAWKENETERLVRLALDAGFRAVDTANQRRHYFEAGVGEAIRKSGIKREELFLQTKFTYIDSQDQRLPYDADASPSKQVEQSFASSLEHLQTDRIDSYILHGPSQRRGLGSIDIEVWQAMETLPVSHLGISNVAPDQLDRLLAVVKVRPAFVQNRCFARNGWDFDVRAFCRANGITYQGFSLLTANVAELKHPSFREIVDRVERTPAQVVFRFATQIGMLPLTGTTDPDHMHEDLAIDDFELTDDELRAIETIARN